MAVSLDSDKPERRCIQQREERSQPPHRSRRSTPWWVFFGFRVVRSLCHLHLYTPMTEHYLYKMQRHICQL